MKTVKKMLVAVLAFAVTLSLFAGLGANAAAPVTFEGTQTVLFDQSFGISSAEEATDFSIKGDNWTYTDYFALSANSNGNSTNSSIYTKESYDLSQEAGFEFEAKIKCTHNGNSIKLPNGYEVIWENNSKKLSLKNGSTVLNSVSAEFYGADTVYNIKYLNGLWTVNAESRTVKCSFTYQDDTNPSFNGKFGVLANYTGEFIVFYMKLSKIADTVTVNHWKYEKTFSSKDSLEDLKKDGFDWKTDPTLSDNGGIIMGGSNYLTYSPLGKELLGSYHFETKVKREYNQNYVDFGYKDDKNFYRLFMPKKEDNSDNKGVRLIKRVDGVDEIVANKAYENEASAADWLETTWAVDVVANSNGSITINAKGSGSATNETFDLSYTDASPIEDGKIHLLWSYSGGSSSCKYLNVRSVVTEEEKTAEEPVVFSNKIIDKTFSLGDTVESLANINIIAPDVTIDNEGIHSADKAVTYSGDLGDNYSFSAKMYRNYNDSYIRFGYSGDKYYYVKAGYSNASNKVIGIYRSDSTAALASFTDGNIDHYGYGTTSDYKVDVTTEDGKKTIKLTFKGKGAETVLTATDENPITGGSNVEMYANSAGIVKSFSLVKFAETYDESVVNKTFSLGDTVESLKNINITAPNVTIDNDGIHSAGSAVTYSGDLGDNYSFSAKMFRQYNDSNIRFGYSGSVYYYVKSRYASGTDKVIGIYRSDSTTPLASFSETMDASYYGYNQTSDYKVDVTTKDGVKTIKFTFKSNGKETVVTATDKNPITGGSNVEMQANSAGIVKSFSLVKTLGAQWYDESGVPVFSGNFYGSQGRITNVSNGAVYFEYPVARFGEYKAVATLHENNKMTAIKVIEPSELYAGKVKLFNVSDEQNAKVRVYFFDNEKTLNRITKVYELN